MNEITEVINKQIARERVILNDFESLWNEFDLMMQLRNATLIHLKRTKLKLSLDTIIVQQNPIIMKQLYALRQLVNEKIDIIKDEQELLDIIKRNIIRLQLHRIEKFNCDFRDLITLIRKKNDFICKSALNDVKLSLIALKGQEITEKDIESEFDINSLDERIEEKTLSLGLKDIENK